MPLDPRARRGRLGGGARIGALILYLVLRGGGSGPPAQPARTDTVVTLPADRPATYAAPVQPPIIVMPGPSAVAGAPVAVVPTADASQLRLFGLLSRGAVIGMPDGTQHFVPVGREIMPGVTLRGVDVHHAILATPSGEVRLGFDSAADPQIPVVAAPVPMSG